MKQKIKDSKIVRIGRRTVTRISPELASKIFYRVKFKKPLDLKDPKTFNEKLQWLKLYNRDDLKSICADKYEVTNYAKECSCPEIVNEVYNLYNSVDEIEWDRLPEKFALKCTHSCATNIICNDKSKLDIEDAKKKLKKWMKEDYSLDFAEIHYKKIKPRIICEKYLETDAGLFPVDYKLFCFDGEPKVAMVCSNRGSEKTKFYLYDNDWNIKPYNKNGVEAIKNNLEKDTSNRPKTFPQMLEYAKKLSSPFPFVRVDFYEVDGKVILGEMTFTPCACLDANLTKEAEEEMGALIKLPNKNI